MTSFYLFIFFFCSTAADPTAVGKSCALGSRCKWRFYVRISEPLFFDGMVIVDAEKQKKKN